MATAVERLDFRLDRPSKQRIRNAAALRGETVSAFAVSVLLREADSILKDHATITLNAKASREFLDRADKDIKPNAKLRRAAKRHRGLTA